MPKAVDRECFVVPIRAQLAGRRNRCGIANQDIQPLSYSRRFNPLLQRSCRRPRLPNTDKVQLMEVDRPGPLLLARMFLDPHERFLYARTLPRYVWRAGVHSRPAKRQVDSRALSDPLRSAGGDVIISALVSAKDKGATPSLHGGGLPIPCYDGHFARQVLQRCKELIFLHAGGR
jgi:hypothetical protein